MRLLIRSSDGLFVRRLENALDAAGIDCNVTTNPPGNFFSRMQFVVWVADDADKTVIEALCQRAHDSLDDQLQTRPTRVSSSEGLFVCRKCQYDLRGQTTGGNCPECGHPYRLIAQKLCPACRETIPVDFEICWNCNAALAGNSAVLSPEEASCLSRDGFLLSPNAATSGLLGSLTKAVEELPPAHAHRNLLQIEAVRRFANGPSAMSLISSIIGPNAIPVRGILFDKIPAANWKVAWHQDLSIAVKARHDFPGFGPWSVKEGVPHVQPPMHILENMLTLRLHLDDCLQDNGPLRLLPGTHAMGFLPPARIESLRQQISEVPATLLAGGILLMRPLVLHASSAATNPSHRRVIHIEYAAAELPSPLQWHAA